ncbi:MAG: hypothetical protein KAR44_01030 [Candidatus Aegiribacteria sp.]|nr:hypothetical protein [Candidatus Aegiribacteria sp.]
MDENESCETPFSKTECNDLLSAFEYPLKQYEVPYWNSHILNFPPVRKLLEDCSNHGEQVTLEIRKHSLVIIDFLQHRMDIFYSRDNVHTIIEGRVDPLIFTPFLHDIRALIVHSSCVSFDGRAAVFLAMDEGGKTTAANLCKGGRVLADDQIIFRKQDDGGWLAYGTPWTTFPPDPDHAVPAAFFLLEKADEFSLTELSSRELFSFLWGEHFKIRFQIPSMYQTTLFDLYRELSSSASVYLMKSPKDYIDQDAILKCMKP